MGGEKSMAVFWAAVVLGSPPRGRGKDKPLPISDIPVGITPAWAGKRAFFGLVSHVPWDHPRVGGEKFSHMLL